MVNQPNRCDYKKSYNDSDSDFAERFLPWIMYFIGGIGGWICCGVLYGIYFV